ncbi:MAG: hypothetical protein ACRYFE_04545 [Janthinobacterium lividum]
MAEILNTLSVLSALLAAFYWFLSAKEKVPYVESLEERQAKGQGINMSEMNDNTVKLSRALHKQGKFSSRGALFAAISASFQIGIFLWPYYTQLICANI